MFARLAHERLGMKAIGDVKKIAKFRAGKGELALDLAGSSRRVSQHCDAAKLCFIQWGRERKVRDMLLCGSSFIAAVILRA